MKSLLMPCLPRSAGLAFFLALIAPTTFAFEFPNPFSAPNKAAVPSSSSVKAMKESLLQAVSGTNNGKSATPDRQAAVLKLVRQLETKAPSPAGILTTEAALIDGPWYLQYTSPSDIGDPDAYEFPDAWKPLNAKEGDAQIETRQFNAQGSVSAAGLPVSTANRVVVQRIDTTNARVTNEISLDWADVVVGGAFRASSTVPTRAVVAFDTANITPKAFGSALSLKLGWLFGIIAATRGGQRDNGWLETTFIDDEMRIGRGNKGTCFVLTRAVDAVTS